MPGPCPFIDVSVYGVMLACLADIHFSSAVHTADYFPFRYVSLLFASYVGIYNVIDYMDLANTNTMLANSSTSSVVSCCAKLPR